MAFWNLEIFSLSLEDQIYPLSSVVQGISAALAAVGRMAETYRRDPISRVFKAFLYSASLLSISSNSFFDQTLFRNAPTLFHNFPLSFTLKPSSLLASSPAS